MRWIGQHIWPFKSRMRSDVIIEKDSSLYMGTTKILSNVGTNTRLHDIDGIDATSAASINAGIVLAGLGSAGDVTGIDAGTGLAGTDLGGPVPVLNVESAQPVIESVGLNDRAVVIGFSASDPECKLTIGEVSAIFKIGTTDNMTITATAWTPPHDTINLGADDARFKNGYFEEVISTNATVSAGGGFVGNASSATVATNVTVVDSAATDATYYPALVDGLSGTQGIETESALTYNPSTGLLTSTDFAGDLAGDVTGNADTATNLVASTSTAVQLGSVELGHATDTTLERVSGGGDVNVEGNLIYRAGGTDVAIADGGTGANYVASVTAGTGLTSTGATSGKTIAHTLSVDATQPSIESIGTAGDTLAILGDDINLINITSTKPNIFVSNTYNDSRCAAFEFRSERNTGSVLAGNDGDKIGEIKFRGYNDGTPALIAWGDIKSFIVDASTGAEKGQLDFSVGGNGSARLGMSIIGAGASADITMPGILTAKEVRSNYKTPVATGAGANSFVTEMNIEKIGSNIITSIFVDLGEGADCPNVVNGIIADDTTSDPYLTQVTSALNGIVYEIGMLCLEVPVDGSADINLAAHSVGTLNFGDNVLTASPGGVDLINASGVWTLGKQQKAYPVITPNHYVYLSTYVADPDTYTEGKFLIRLYGASTAGL